MKRFLEIIVLSAVLALSLALLTKGVSLVIAALFGILLPWYQSLLILIAVELAVLIVWVWMMDRRRY